jgi:hypothetical protein
MHGIGVLVDQYRYRPIEGINSIIQYSYKIATTGRDHYILPYASRPYTSVTVSSTIGRCTGIGTGRKVGSIGE